MTSNPPQKYPLLFRLFSFVLLAATLFLYGCRPSAPKAEDAGGDDAKKGPVTVEFAVAERRPMETTIEAQGTVTPSQGSIAHVAPAAPGRLISVLVKEGDQVRGGQLVAVLDNRPQQAAAGGAQTAVGVSEALASEADLTAKAAALDQRNAVRVAQLSVETAKLDRDGAVRAAQNQLQAAETDQRKTKNGPRPQEIAQADQAVAQAAATRTHAHSELERNQRLLAGGVASQRQLEEAKAASDVADSAYESAKSQASLMHSGSRQEDIEAAQIRVDGIKEALRLAKTDGDAHVAQAESALRQAEQSFVAVRAKEKDAAAQAAAARQKRFDLAAAQATAGYAEVRAPIGGVVTRRALNPGDMADVNIPIVDISNTNGLDLLASLPADEGARLHAGMRARIATRDLPDQTLSGTVISVGQVDPATNLLTLRVSIQGAAGRLKSGSFALATVVLSNNPRAVVVPKAAVLSKDTKSMVYVAGQDNIAHQKEVEIGPEQNGFVAIVNGIKAGDRVVVLGSYELADGSEVREAEKAGDKKEGGDTPVEGKPGPDNGKDVGK